MRAATGFMPRENEKDDKSISTAKIVLSTKGSVSNYVIEKKEPVLVDDIHSDPRFQVPAKSDAKYKSSSFISAPILHDQEVIGIINLTDKEDNQKFSNEDVNLISIFTFQVAIGIEKIKFLDRMVEQERIEQELKVGKDMQFSLLPASIPDHSDIEIYANLEPAKEIGGDLYHFVNIDENNMGFIVGDVAGKGVQAGLFMAMSSVILKDKRLPSPASVLYYTNKSLIEYFEEATPSYLTAIYLMYDKSEKILKMAKAGHEPPIFIDGNTGNIEYVEDDVGGLPLGMFFFPDTKYEEKIFKVKKGDTFILYTDGFPEATNPNGEIMGREEFVKTIHQAPKDDLAKMGEFLYEKAIEHTGEADRFDDMTLMILRIK
jgi:sigma-B regulation protein RsbU (phosphoserine phosphatase)